jgi:hypothetical protein
MRAIYAALKPRLSRAALDTVIQTAIAKLDRYDGDLDCELNCGDLDHFPDNAMVHPLDAAPFSRSNLVRQKGRCYAA